MKRILQTVTNAPGAIVRAWRHRKRPVPVGEAIAACAAIMVLGLSTMANANNNTVINQSDGITAVQNMAGFDATVTANKNNDNNIFTAASGQAYVNEINTAVTIGQLGNNTTGTIIGNVAANANATSANLTAIHFRSDSGGAPNELAANANVNNANQHATTPANTNVIQANANGNCATMATVDREGTGGFSRTLATANVFTDGSA